MTDCKHVELKTTRAMAFTVVDLGNLSLLFVLACGLYFLELGGLPFYERGEGREGLVIWEMVHSGNWILPTVNAEYIPFKPPLFHWISLGLTSAIGYLNEFTIRFPSALFGTAGVLLTYWVGSRWWNRRAGLAAGLVLITSFGWWQAATIAQVDMVFAFFVSASLMLFYSLYRAEKNRAQKAMGLAVLLALATLAKGPLGTAAPAFVIVLFLLLQKDLRFVTRLPLFWGSVTYFLIAGSWYALAYAQGGWSFLQRQIVDETVLTGVGTYGRYQPPYYYLPVVFYNLAPWSFFSPALGAFLYQRRRRLSLDALQYLLVWFVGILAFYSLARGKRGIYMLPLYPAFALLFGAWWSTLGAEKQESAVPARWMGWLYVNLCTLVALGIGVYMAGDPASTAGRFRSLTRKLQAVGFLQADGHNFAANIKYSMAILSALLFFLAFSLWRKSWPAVFASLAIIAIVQLVLIRTVYFPHFVTPRTFKPFMARVIQKIGPSTPLKFYRAFDAAAIFYADRHIPQYETLSATLQRQFLLMWEEDFERLKGANSLAAVDISEGLGPALRHRLMLVEPRADGALVDTVAPHKSNTND